MKRYCEECNYELDDGYKDSETLCGACVNVAEGGSPGDAPACGASVRDRLAWIDEQVAVAVTYYEKIPHSGSVRFDACQILGVVTEFADLLRVHFAGVES